MSSNFFSRLFGSKKNPDSLAYRREMAEKIAGHRIRYVTEKVDGVDEIIGREGSIDLRNGEFIVFASSNVVFRCDIDLLQAWELLSKDGVVVTAPDKEHGGVERTIIVYYVYYR
ncbi:MAG: hypothetical protein IKC59_07810 [Clostridia bacterium]|nr:hypothetical protein [Clostridia bacterium]